VHHFAIRDRQTNLAASWRNLLAWQSFWIAPEPLVLAKNSNTVDGLLGRSMTTTHSCKQLLLFVVEFEGMPNVGWIQYQESNRTKGIGKRENRIFLQQLNVFIRWTSESKILWSQDGWHSKWSDGLERQMVPQMSLPEGSLPANRELIPPVRRQERLNPLSRMLIKSARTWKCHPPVVNRWLSKIETFEYYSMTDLVSCHSVKESNSRGKITE